jgi:hypothetical protein
MMVYKFMMDGSGKVIAEKRDENIESYLGFIILNPIFRNRQENFILKKEKEFSAMFIRKLFLSSAKSVKQ